MASFDESIVYVLQNEGGFVDNPNDIGAATNFGITLHILSIFRKTQCTIDDIKNLGKDEASLIYKNIFWLPMKLDQVIDNSIATAIFDIAVNNGPHFSIVTSQIICDVKADGAMGPETIAAINSKSPSMFIATFQSAVANHYEQIAATNPSQAVFLKGWLNRSERLTTLVS